MNRIVIALTVLTACFYVCEAGMDCGIAGTCPGINKIGEAFTGEASGKDYCCRTDVASIPYCCTVGDYAKYKWDRFTGGSSAISTNQKVVAGSAIGAVLLAMLV
ncbi:uncharacterized protein LOC129587478 [Paramacrobiotus metropolitanus]|uniref:uncharacterized protein LOC129587478 n=1 Tax=Paramacrobiotus metropolitanus TaxID=2943436 RepID=UPI00244583A4|nr:uncharacterized protein LOC129587478 [Paramacrobiotus metropolitanus]XP_055337219.1 uncharacterized protein LOC129587478 [Paramacrobiotus metropolitanus]XP_055337220.1 uncharacterized protein LOC129587478 [Paramacrobiotus metropolitanus]XP_055337221.1 uncharacterized protein LOC129587478 [Paramacrobiotus metropolitanus]XP_055337223.1 uncharacterized protein LOC129587478 [Paramacrobiotus metropolitanus]